MATPIPTGSLELRLESDDFSSDAIDVREASGSERISELFVFDVLVACRDANVRIEAGHSASLAFLEDGQETRRVHGVVAECVEQLDSESEATLFRLKLKPRAHRLSLVKMQEIFLEQTVPGIVEQKLSLTGVDAELRLQSGGPVYRPRPFVVQYRETDLDFVRRLSEHLGISFFFETRQGRDWMVLTDDRAGFAPAGPNLPYRGRGEKRDVYALGVQTRLVPSLFGVADYNDESPHVELMAVQRKDTGSGGGVIEWGTHHRTPDEGAVLAQVRSEEAHATQRVLCGESTAVALAAGRRTVIEGHPRFHELSLLVVAVEHRATREGGKLAYHNRFEAIPAETRFRPPRITQKPRIWGVTHGVVRAAPGSDTTAPWIDAHGRYVIEMLFESARDAQRVASLPIRMAQSHAGPNHGVHFPLRPGTEVVIAFVDGDPDRPVILGAVHNGMAPNVVNQRDALKHRIRTASGVLLEINDGG